MNCFFVSDLHGSLSRYEKLFESIDSDVPDIVFIGGDILPSFGHSVRSTGKYDDFIDDFLVKNLFSLKTKLKEKYPEIFIILGNDDVKVEEVRIKEAEKSGIFKYINFRFFEFNGLKIFGYCYVPPSPFLLKDWEKYDVSRYVDPGCVSPEEGYRSISVEPNFIKYSTIKEDLEKLTAGENLSASIFLFHSPPYQTNLDRVANDGKTFEHVPLDLFAGSIAIKNFIEKKQPLITLHGHIHESTRLTGSWMDRIGKTYCFNASHDGRELSLIKFNTKNPDEAIRVLL